MSKLNSLYNEFWKEKNNQTANNENLYKYQRAFQPRSIFNKYQKPKAQMRNGQAQNQRPYFSH